MNKNTIFSTILAVAVVILFVLHFTSKSSSSTTPAPILNEEGESTRLPVAYVNLDSLLNNYEYAVEMRDKVLRKAESSQATLNQQGRSLENEMREFQHKLENNAFFDQSRAQREQERILTKRQEFEQLTQKLQIELMQEEQQMNEKLKEEILKHLRSYNEEVGKYHIIFSNAAQDNILLADPAYDITQQVTDYLNKQYKGGSNTALQEDSTAVK